jgi:glyoxylase-like metal-dependent hydrolase (beta-lactamase superfamily II)
MHITVRLPALIVALGVASSVLVAQRGPVADPLIREGVTAKLGAHTYGIPDGNVSLVPNVGIIVGSEATLVIDPGLGRRNGETVLREVAKVSGNRRLYVASTHFHAEHTTGYLAFPPDATYVNSNVQEAEFAEGGLQMVEMFSRRSPLTAEILAGTTRRVADVTYDDEHRLDLGGVTVRMIVVGPAHTRGDTAFFVEQDRVLFTGDFVMNQSFVAAGGAASMRDWLAGLDRLEALGPTTVVPAHGAFGTGAMIGANRAFIQEINTRTLALKKQGRPTDEIAQTVTTELTAKHPGWPRANGIGNLVRAAHAEAP